MKSNCNFSVFIIQSQFLNNTASNGGVFYSKNTTIKDSENIYTLNSARHGAVIYISKSQLMVSNPIVSSNCASRQGIDTGRINFTANDLQQLSLPDDSFRGGAITTIFSLITFNARGDFHNNQAYDFGGAICSINSFINILKNTDISKSWALKGGAIYLYQSYLLLKDQVNIYDNYANISGGGIHSINSFIWLSLKGSLLFMRDSAERGGGIFLTKNSKISIPGVAGLGGFIWELRIRLIHNTASLYGGGIFIDDEASPISCAASKTPLSGLENECFFQAQIFYAQDWIKYMFFNLNEAQRGSNLYGGMFDWCTSGLLNNNRGVRALRYLQVL